MTTSISNYEQNGYTNPFIFLNNHNLLFKVLKHIFEWDNTSTIDFKKGNLQKLIPLMKTNKTVFELVLRALNENRSYMNINYINFFEKGCNIAEVYKFRDEIKKQLKAGNREWFDNHYFLFYELTLSNTLRFEYNYISVNDFYNLIGLMGHNYLNIIKFDLGSFIITETNGTNSILIPNNGVDIKDINLKRSHFVDYIKRKHRRKRKYLLKGYYYLELDNLITVLNDNYIVNVEHDYNINNNDFIEYLGKVNINNLSFKFITINSFNLTFNHIMENCSNKQINMFELNLNKIPQSVEIPMQLIQTFIQNNNIRYFKLSNYYCEFERCTQLINWFNRLDVYGVLYELNHVLYHRLNDFNVELFQDKIRYILKNIDNPLRIQMPLTGFGSAYNILRIMSGMNGIAYAS